MAVVAYEGTLGFFFDLLVTDLQTFCEETVYPFKITQAILTSRIKRSNLIP